MYTFTIPLTPEQFNAKRVELARDQGIAIMPDSGILNQDGVEVQYAYDPTTNKLTLIVLKKPFFIPMEEIVKHLTVWLTRA